MTPQTSPAVPPAPSMSGPSTSRTPTTPTTNPSICRGLSRSRRKSRGEQGGEHRAERVHQRGERGTEAGVEGEVHRAELDAVEHEPRERDPDGVGAGDPEGATKRPREQPGEHGGEHEPARDQAERRDGVDAVRPGDVARGPHQHEPGGRDEGQAGCGRDGDDALCVCDGRLPRLRARGTVPRPLRTLVVVNSCLPDSGSMTDPAHPKVISESVDVDAPRRGGLLDPLRPAAARPHRRVRLGAGARQGTRTAEQGRDVRHGHEAVRPALQDPQHRRGVRRGPADRLAALRRAPLALRARADRRRHAGDRVVRLQQVRPDPAPGRGARRFPEAQPRGHRRDAGQAPEAAESDAKGQAA